MKLTKEECIKALESLKPMTIKEFRKKDYLPFIGANRILTQLIEEHFDNNLTTKLQNLTTENSQLRYDLHFMEINFREACDHANEFLEMVKELEKTLEEVREQGAYYMNECNRLRKQLEKNNE